MGFLVLDFQTCILFLPGTHSRTPRLQNNPGILGERSPRTPGSVLLLWMENCGAEMVC